MDPASKLPSGAEQTALTITQPFTPSDHEVDYAATLLVFTLACLIGLGVIKGVSRLLHTPLMSLTNAISAIAVLGALLLAGGDHPDHIQVLGGIAVFASTINAVSGFLITHRMLSMFKSKKATTNKEKP